MVAERYAPNKRSKTLKIIINFHKYCLKSIYTKAGRVITMSFAALGRMCVIALKTITSFRLSITFSHYAQLQAKIRQPEVYKDWSEAAIQMVCDGASIIDHAVLSTAAVAAALLALLPRAFTSTLLKDGDKVVDEQVFMAIGLRKVKDAGAAEVLDEAVLIAAT
uniref:Uncharacterized protein n=1 Tax=Romanomermis culicivorax TaxID=13658 RepID=A0A915HIZ5_ROMCU